MSPKAGVLLRRKLDRSSPTARFEARALQQELAELQQSLGPVRMVTAVKRRGAEVEVSVLAASSTRTVAKSKTPTSASGASVSAWRPDW